VNSENVSSEPPAADAEDEHGRYGIGVAAEMVGTGIQNLRLYERRGLLEPTRTPGGTRLYSRNDVVRLGRITALLAEGLNLVGVDMVLRLQDDLAEARREADQRRPAASRRRPRPPADPSAGD
jgi:MerR family transcriptional regulator/heat shock protein HspR